MCLRFIHFFLGDGPIGLTRPSNPSALSTQFYYRSAGLVRFRTELTHVDDGRRAGVVTASVRETREKKISDHVSRESTRDDGKTIKDHVRLPSTTDKRDFTRFAPITAPTLYDNTTTSSHRFRVIVIPTDVLLCLLYTCRRRYYITIRGDSYLLSAPVMVLRVFFSVLVQSDHVSSP